jgi:hypothetical protein
VLVNPETVVRWHRAGFRLYWSLISRARRRVGRKKLSKEVRDLIFQMVAENPSWGAPRIHGELLLLGFDVSERTISRWMKRAPRAPQPAQRWRVFPANHGSDCGHGLLHRAQIDVVSADHDINAYLNLLGRDGNLTIVGAPPKPLVSLPLP